MYKELSEQELVRFCCQRDKLAQDELYIRYAARVYTLCRRYLGDDEEAKDLMQETLIQVMDRISSFEYKSTGSLYAWISRIAVNRALNLIKRQRWRWVTLSGNIRDTMADPDESEIEKIPEEKLLEWITELTNVRRAVFNMFCIDGYSHREIAAMLGISEKGSASILAKAKKQLKERIKQYWRAQGK